MNLQNSPTIRLNKSLQQFSNDVADYLMPAIAFVGNNDEMFSRVQTAFKWVEKIDTPNYVDYEIYILNSLPENFVEEFNQLPRTAIYVICQQKRTIYKNSELEFLKNTLSVTLFEPSAEIITLHVKAMLLIRDAMYWTNQKQPLLSVDQKYRDSISALIRAIIKNQTIVLNIDSIDHANLVQHFLFEPIPSEIKPLEIKNNGFEYSTNNSHRYHILTNPSKTLISKIKEDYLDTSHANPKLFIIQTHQSKNNSTIQLNQATSISLENLQNRDTDLILINYLATIDISHSQPLLTYLSESVVKSICQEVNFNQFQYFQSASKALESCSGTTEFRELKKTLHKYDRLSLKTILNALEKDILEKLYHETQSVDAVVQATNLPNQTYYKRKKRISEIPNIISLIR